MSRRIVGVLAAGMLASTLQAQGGRDMPAGRDTLGYAAQECSSCAVWNEATPPVNIFGNTFYVGTRGLSAILITSPRGHILIDGGLPNSAPLIARNIRALGFRLEDVRLIVLSHAHYDHAGGVAALQRMTGARVVALPSAARVLRAGVPGVDDPQHAIALAFPPLSRVDTIADGDTLRVGALSIVAHATPGHTPGGTTWSWRACEDNVCLDLVYADSMTPVSADDFRFTDSRSYPTALSDFEQSFAVLEGMSCDLLLTPHPSASNFWNRIEKRANARLTDAGSCRRYAATARRALADRVVREQGPGR